MNTPLRTLLTRRRTRLLACAAAVLLSLLPWAVVDPLLGHPLIVVDGSDTLELGAAAMLLVSTAAALLGWGSLALLERLTRAARRIWLALALAVLAVSFLPVAGGETDTVTRAVLAAAHLVVAAALIPAFVATSPRTAAGSPGRISTPLDQETAPE